MKTPWNFSDYQSKCCHNDRVTTVTFRSSTCPIRAGICRLFCVVNFEQAQSNGCRNRYAGMQKSHPFRPQEWRGQPFVPGAIGPVERCYTMSGGNLSHCYFFQLSGPSSHIASSDIRQALRPALMCTDFGRRPAFIFCHKAARINEVMCSTSDVRTNRSSTFSLILAVLEAPKIRGAFQG